MRLLLKTQSLCYDRSLSVSTAGDCYPWLFFYFTHMTSETLPVWCEVLNLPNINPGVKHAAPCCVCPAFSTELSFPQLSKCWLIWFPWAGSNKRNIQRNIMWLFFKDFSIMDRSLFIIPLNTWLLTKKNSHLPQNIDLQWCYWFNNGPP